MSYYITYDLVVVMNLCSRREGDRDILVNLNRPNITSLLIDCSMYSTVIVFLRYYDMILWGDEKDDSNDDIDGNDEGDSNGNEGDKRLWWWEMSQGNSSFHIAVIEMTVTDRDHLETSPQLRFFHPCHPILW